MTFIFPPLVAIAGIGGAAAIYTLLGSIPIASFVLALGIVGSLFCAVMFRR